MVEGKTQFDQKSAIFRRLLAVSAGLGLASLVLACGLPSNASSASNPSSTCGEAAWTILDQKSGTTLFAGKADCTTVQSNGILVSNMTGGAGPLQLEIRYQNAGASTCSGESVSVNLVGVPPSSPGLQASYYAGQGNPPPLGSSCDLSIGALPNGPALVSGGITAVLGRCGVVGGCDKPSDWDLVKVDGSFDAYFSGP